MRNSWRPLWGSNDEEDKTINLITIAFDEGANIHDGMSTIPSIEAADEAGFKPEKLYRDTAYGADSTVEEAKELGVEVISPAGSKDPELGKFRVSDFKFKTRRYWLALKARSFGLLILPKVDEKFATSINLSAINALKQTFAQ